MSPSSERSTGRRFSRVQQPEFLTALKTRRWSHFRTAQNVYDSRDIPYNPGNMLKRCLESGLVTVMLAILTLPALAGTPIGKFQCRRYPPQENTSPYGDPVAYIWLRPNDAYEFLDLTTTTGKTSGQFVYESKKHEVDWTTGDLSKYIGHYAQHIAGTSGIRLNTKEDPRGRVDGTMWCVRVPEPKAE